MSTGINFKICPCQADFKQLENQIIIRAKGKTALPIRLGSRKAAADKSADPKYYNSLVFTPRDKPQIPLARRLDFERVQKEIALGLSSPTHTPRQMQFTDNKIKDKQSLNTSSPESTPTSTAQSYTPQAQSRSMGVVRRYKPSLEQMAACLEQSYNLMQLQNNSRQTHMPVSNSKTKQGIIFGGQGFPRVGVPIQNVPNPATLSNSNSMIELSRMSSGRLSIITERSNEGSEHSRIINRTAKITRISTKNNNLLNIQLQMGDSEYLQAESSGRNPTITEEQDSVVDEECYINKAGAIDNPESYRYMAWKK